MTESVFRAILGGVLLASVFALGVVKVEDTDAWTHLALGRDIVQHRGFPATEQFNFPSLDAPYHNSEWLFGLVFYLAYFVGGIPGVILLKASIVTLAFFILFNDALIPRGPPSHRHLGLIVALLVFVPILLMVRHRIVERPDIVLMVFLGFTIYALNAYVYEGRRYLYPLPVIQVLWVNMHPSIVVVTVPFIAFLVGGQLQRLLRERFGVEVPGTPSRSQLRTIAVVFLAVLATSLLNPYGIGPFFAPFQLATSQWYMHEVLELQPPGFQLLYGAPFIVTALLGLVFVVSFRRLSLVSILLVVPFIYLALSAQRFIFLLGIVSGPILVRHLRSFAERIPRAWVRRLCLPAGLCAVSLAVVVAGLSLPRVITLGDPGKVPGFGIDYNFVPEGALRFLDRVGVFGRVLNTFQWGGYIVWRDYPRRMPFVDGRGHVPPELIEDIKQARLKASRLERLQATYGFEILILDYPRNVEVFGGVVPSTDLGLSSPGWALVYWDDLSLVYLKRTDALSGIIERYEYRHVKPANGFSYLKAKLQDRNLLAAIEAELRRNISESQSSYGYLLLGSVYNEIGAYEKAIESLSHVRDLPSNSLAGTYLGLAFAHRRLGDGKRAIAYYKKAVKLAETGQTLYALGTALVEVGNDREAIRYFERALEKNRRFAWIYPSLIGAYRRIGRTENLKTLQAAYEEALAHGQGESHFRKGVKLYFEGKRHEAMAEFQESLKVNPNNPAALSNLGYVYFDGGLLDMAFTQQKRALEIDPRYANAHYGLALIYRTRGNHGMARKHLKQYLQLEPRGYYSRKAQEMLSRTPER